MYNEEQKTVTVRPPREVVQEHLDRLNEACHQHARTLRSSIRTPQELAAKCQEIRRTNQVFREEHEWMWNAGYPFFVFFPYDRASGNHIWPPDEPQ